MASAWMGQADYAWTARCNTTIYLGIGVPRSWQKLTWGSLLANPPVPCAARKQAPQGWRWSLKFSWDDGGRPALSAMHLLFCSDTARCLQHLLTPSVQPAVLKGSVCVLWSGMFGIYHTFYVTSDLLAQAVSQCRQLLQKFQNSSLCP